MSGDRHDMSEVEWDILHSILPHKHQARNGCATKG